MNPTLTAEPTSGTYTIAPDRDWRATVRLPLPALLHVLRNLRPTWEMPHLDAIDGEFLRAAGLRGLIWDVDGTLTSYHGRKIAGAVTHVLERLMTEEGIAHAIVSNCGEERYEELAGIFPRVPLIKGYESARGPVFRMRLASVETWSSPPCGTLVPIRKPQGSLIDFARHVLDVREPAAVAVIGDQYLTDIASANLAGVRSIKVPTLRPETFPASVRVLQKIDAWAYRLAR
jgi:predicted HAD superfamily phosphohydrolase YqeG